MTLVQRCTKDLFVDAIPPDKALLPAIAITDEQKPPSLLTFNPTATASLGWLYLLITRSLFHARMTCLSKYGIQHGWNGV